MSPSPLNALRGAYKELRESEGGVPQGTHLIFFNLGLSTSVAKVTAWPLCYLSRDGGY